MSKPKYPPPGAVVELTWADTAYASPYWQSPARAEAHQPVGIVSVGYLSKATDECVTIVQSRHPDEVGGVFTIPAGWITEVKVLAQGEVTDG